MSDEKEKDDMKGLWAMAEAHEGPSPDDPTPEYTPLDDFRREVLTECFDKLKTLVENPKCNKEAVVQAVTELAGLLWAEDMIGHKSNTAMVSFSAAKSDKGDCPCGKPHPALTLTLLATLGEGGKEVVEEFVRECEARGAVRTKGRCESMSEILARTGAEAPEAEDPMLPYVPSPDSIN